MGEPRGRDAAEIVVDTSQFVTFGAPSLQENRQFGTNPWSSRPMRRPLLALIAAMAAASALLPAAPLRVAAPGACAPIATPRSRSVHSQTPSSHHLAEGVLLWTLGGGGRAAPRRASAARRAATRCSLDDEDDEAHFEVGARVRVVADAEVKLMHVPGFKEGFDAGGAEGTVVRTYEESNLSPNRKVKVQFDGEKRWVAHFDPWELEAIE